MRFLSVLGPEIRGKSAAAAAPIEENPVTLLDAAGQVEFGELKQALAQDYRDPVPDLYLVRFLRVNNNNGTAALGAVREYRRWHLQFNPQTLIRDFVIPRTLQYFWPGRYHGFDRSGRPLYILRAASLDGPGLARATDASRDAQEKFHTHSLEMGEYYMDRVRERYGCTVTQVVVIYDVGGISVAQYDAKYLGFITEMFDLEQRYYPDRIHAVHFVNTASVFKYFWDMTTPYLKEHLRDLVHVHKGDFRHTLLEHIDPRMLPEWLGGTCTACPGGCVPAGGEVPDEVLSDQGTASQSFVRAVNRRSIYRCSLPVSHADTAVRVMFRTADRDIDFAVLSTRHDRDRLHEYEVRPMTRYDSHRKKIKLEFMAQPGMYTLVWDNTFSVLTDKEVTFRVSTSVIPDAIGDEI